MDNRDEIYGSYRELVKRLEAGNLGPVQKVRDLSVLPLMRGLWLVLACDSNASIGEKPADFKPFPYGECAVSALKVPLMEVVAAGATPVVIANNLCVEMDGAGKKIIGAMEKELRRCGLWDKVQFTGSTEDNMKTTQTGMGVTVVGLATDETLRIGKTRAGDAVVCVGMPQSGIVVPYSEMDGDVAKIDTVQALASLSYVHEILPIGSKGARYEAGQLAGAHTFAEEAEPGVDMETSAGSSTAVLASLAPGDVDRLKKEIGAPCHLVGHIK